MIHVDPIVSSVLYSGLSCVSPRLRRDAQEPASRFATPRLQKSAPNALGNESRKNRESAENFEWLQGDVDKFQDLEVMEKAKDAYERARVSFCPAQLIDSTQFD